MDELIKKQDAIDALFEWYETPMNQDAVDVICNVPSAQQWIPVSEKYPKPEEEYKNFLTVDDKGEITIQEFLLSLDEEPQPYFTGMIQVVAWMPLPNPYEEKDVE